MAPSRRATRIAAVAAASLLAACAQADKRPTEESIDNVWHKAKLRGVAFRAVGQEPGWLLEIIDGEEILLVTNYGANRKSLPYVDPVMYQHERRTQYVLSDYSTTIEIRGEACTDTMNGELFEVSVTLYLEDKELKGCGRALF